jgi:hypothetical protein
MLIVSLLALFGLTVSVVGLAVYGATQPQRRLPLVTRLGHRTNLPAFPLEMIDLAAEDLAKTFARHHGATASLCRGVLAGYGTLWVPGINRDGQQIRAFKHEGELVAGVRLSGWALVAFTREDVSRARLVATAWFHEMAHELEHKTIPRDRRSPGGPGHDWCPATKAALAEIHGRW